MNKLKYLILLVVIIFLILCYLQYGREMEVLHTRITREEKEYTEYVDIVANRLFVVDKNQFAKEVIDTFVDNAFNNVKFSFDLGYPTELYIDVYMNNWSDKKSFEIYCILNIEDPSCPKYLEFEIYK